LKHETKVAVLTVSDSASAGTRSDLSGPVVKELLQQNHFAVEKMKIVPDDQEVIEAALRRLTASFPLVITTGGTGIAVRDVTPEATRAVCTRLVEGIAERMRSEGAKKTPLAALSRGLCGIRGTSLVINLPGSPKAAVESLQAVIELLPHALELLQGKTEHADKTLKD
jgi:molybdopterin adenylyltransferase